MQDRMTQSARRLTTIDDSLRFALFGLECMLGVEFIVNEVERIFRDAQADQVSVKEYRLCERGALRVSGLVEEYEPDSIWIHVEGGSIGQARLDELFERAGYQALRLKKAANTATDAQSSLRSDQRGGDHQCLPPASGTRSVPDTYCVVPAT